MTWIIALATICMMGIMTVMFSIARPKFKIIQNLIDRLNLVSRENLSGILIVRAFNTQEFEKNRFDKANKDLAGTHLFLDQAMSFMPPTIALIQNLTTSLIVWVGARQASAFRIEIGDIFAFLQYGMQIIFAFMMVAMMFIMFPRAVVSIGRIKEVLETESSVQFKKKPRKFSDDFNAVVEFRNVSFRYPEGNPLPPEPGPANKKNIGPNDGPGHLTPAVSDSNDNVLDNISFTASPGETTAIIGSTGSGKTTILQLLLRFYDVTQGAVYIDGMDIRDLSKKDLHDKIGYVPQKALLFSGTIHSNLCFADKDATDELILDAAGIAQAKGFIQEKQEPAAGVQESTTQRTASSLPAGYDSNVAQGGANFSGGQRQRLSIARALVKNAPIYLFDDSFSALDLKTDALLRAALKKKTGQSTMLIVAQRISTIMDADKIVVLENGKIAGCGTHAELIRTCEVYREIAASQLSEEEMNR